MMDFNHLEECILHKVYSKKLMLINEQKQGESLFFGLQIGSHFLIIN